MDPTNQNPTTPGPMPSTEDSGVGVPVPPPTSLPPSVPPVVEEPSVVSPPTTPPSVLPEVKTKPRWGKGALVGAIGAILVLVIGVFVGTSVITNLQNKVNPEKKAAQADDDCKTAGGCFNGAECIPAGDSRPQINADSGCSYKCVGPGQWELMSCPSGGGAGSPEADFGCGGTGQYPCAGGKCDGNLQFPSVQGDDKCGEVKADVGGGGNEGGGNVGTCQSGGITYAKCPSGSCSNIYPSQVCSVAEAGQKKCGVETTCTPGNQGCPASGKTIPEYTCQKYTGLAGCDLYRWAGTGSCLVSGNYSDDDFINTGQRISTLTLGSGVACTGYKYTCSGELDLSRGCQNDPAHPNRTGEGTGAFSLPVISCGTVQVDISCRGPKGKVLINGVNCDNNGDGVCRQFMTQEYRNGCVASPPITTLTPPSGTGGWCDIVCTTNANCNNELTCQSRGGKNVCWGNPCESQPTPTPPPANSASCQRLEYYRDGAVLPGGKSDIRVGDVITVRGFASTNNTTVSNIRFTINAGGVAQVYAGTGLQLVGALWQADSPPITIAATSYSISATPIFP